MIREIFSRRCRSEMFRDIMCSWIMWFGSDLLSGGLSRSVLSQIRGRPAALNDPASSQSRSRRTRRRWVDICSTRAPSNCNELQWTRIAYFDYQYWYIYLTHSDPVNDTLNLFISYMRSTQFFKSVQYNLSCTANLILLKNIKPELNFKLKKGDIFQVRIQPFLHICTTWFIALFHYINVRYDRWCHKTSGFIRRISIQTGCFV